MVDFERYMYLVNSPEYAYLEQNEPFSTLKVMICRKYSFQKLPQFSQENNVLDAPPLNTDGVHSGDTCISSTWVKRPTCSNISHSPHWKLWFAWHNPSKTNSILTGKNVLDAAVSCIDGFLWSGAYVSSNQLKDLFGKNELFSTLKTVIC
jgi:hypothetical protein